MRGCRCPGPGPERCNYHTRRHATGASPVGSTSTLKYSLSTNTLKVRTRSDFSGVAAFALDQLAGLGLLHQLVLLLHLNSMVIGLTLSGTSARPYFHQGTSAGDRELRVDQRIVHVGGEIADLRPWPSRVRFEHFGRTAGDRLFAARVALQAPSSALPVDRHGGLAVEAVADPSPAR